MDQIKTGKFIAERRKFKSLTQEQLGEKLGVTNKTISRWETGKYMPDIDKLQELAEILNISVNELLSGELLESKEEIVKKADENIVKAMSESAFTLKDKIHFCKRKWLKDHAFQIVVSVILYIAAVIFATFELELNILVTLPVSILVYYIIVYNRIMAYVEQNAYK